MEQDVPEKPRSGLAIESPGVYACVILTSLSCLVFTAYEDWTGPTAGWAAPVYSCLGTLAFCDWIRSGAPAIRGPHDPDIDRSVMGACAAGFFANVMALAAIAAWPFGAPRLARRLGRAALCFGLASIVLLVGSVRMFELHAGGYLWLASMTLLAFHRRSQP
ncbi:hypothetical protein Pan44_40950 [Caulifigura coniformis]|uniref:Uncharacterized protein n=1 Tax=Caulifigura coniformis TaxID=2527983 RepID=A0A517SIV0_9PLAN|nr:hypothetical protein [Caulifigura coniformis]QDT56045.1 hypothetical protein Pan44_40950 [Caulifigura coniformis]